MSIFYAIIECKDQEHAGWRQVVDKWTWPNFRPDWKHKTDFTDDGDFDRHYYNIEIKSKKDLVLVLMMFTELDIAYPDTKISFHSKVDDAGIGIEATNDKFKIYGGPNLFAINAGAIRDIKAVKELLKNY